MATAEKNVDSAQAGKELEEKILTITSKAMERILRVRENTGESPEAALRIEINGLRDGDFAYDLSFADPSSASEQDTAINCDGLTVLIRTKDIPKIKGSVLDLSDDPNEGLTIDNPNDVWEFVGGDLAKRVQAVLDENVNPAIAMHGGRADLVAVEGSTAYLRLSGGCQGCGLAKVTLSQGIEVAIKEAVPEIESIVDVTDHAAGTNPYYEPAKK
ncbi:MAG: iron-sulfur cluster assembly accessory protein [Acidimicrobiia bacterium]